MHACTNDKKNHHDAIKMRHRNNIELQLLVLGGFGLNATRCNFLNLNDLKR